MKKLRISDIALIIGLLVLAVGAVLSWKKMDDLANYFLIGGAIIVIIRGFIRNHEQ